MPASVGVERRYLRRMRQDEEEEAREGGGGGGGVCAHDPLPPDSIPDHVLGRVPARVRLLGEELKDEQQGLLKEFTAEILK